MALRATGTASNSLAASRRLITLDATYSGGVSTQHERAQDVAIATRTDDVWVTIVWNDPVNLMSYVTHVFQTYFGFTKAEAERRMREVHEKGKSAVSTGGREQMEVDVQAMHSYGLWATMQRSGQ